MGAAAGGEKAAAAVPHQTRLPPDSAHPAQWGRPGGAGGRWGAGVRHKCPAIRPCCTSLLRYASPSSSSSWATPSSSTEGQVRSAWRASSGLPPPMGHAQSRRLDQLQIVHAVAHADGVAQRCAQGLAYGAGRPGPCSRQCTSHRRSPWWCRRTHPAPQSGTRGPALCGAFQRGGVGAHKTQLVNGAAVVLVYGADVVQAGKHLPHPGQLAVGGGAFQGSGA